MPTESMTSVESLALSTKASSSPISNPGASGLSPIEVGGSVRSAWPAWTPPRPHPATPRKATMLSTAQASRARLYLVMSQNAVIEAVRLHPGDLPRIGAVSPDHSRVARRAAAAVVIGDRGDGRVCRDAADVYAAAERFVEGGIGAVFLPGPRGSRPSRIIGRKPEPVGAVGTWREGRNGVLHDVDNRVLETAVRVGVGKIAGEMVCLPFVVKAVKVLHVLVPCPYPMMKTVILPVGGDYAAILLLKLKLPYPPAAATGRGAKDRALNFG